MEGDRARQGEAAKEGVSKGRPDGRMDGLLACDGAVMVGGDFVASAARGETWNTKQLFYLPTCRLLWPKHSI